MARFPSIDSEGAFEAPEVQNSIKELVTGSTDGITVDTSVGTRVFVGNTMIHGDTGWRDIGSDLTSGEPITWCAVRRNGDIVHITINASNIDLGNISLFYAFPTGFRPNAGNAFRHYIYDNSGYMWVIRPNGINTQTAKTGNSNFSTSFPTNDPWPTSLPGTPA